MKGTEPLRNPRRFVSWFLGTQWRRTPVRRYDVGHDDLVSHAMLGLALAHAEYDPANAPCAWSTFATNHMKWAVHSGYNRSVLPKRGGGKAEHVPLHEIVADADDVKIDDALITNAESETLASDAELKLACAAALSTLDERERKIIVMWFGFDQGNDYTQREIAEVFGLSTARTGQIALKALRKLRHHSRADALRGFL